MLVSPLHNINQYNPVNCYKDFLPVLLHGYTAFAWKVAKFPWQISFQVICVKSVFWTDSGGLAIHCVNKLNREIKFTLLPLFLFCLMAVHSLWVLPPPIVHIVHLGEGSVNKEISSSNLSYEILCSYSLICDMTINLTYIGLPPISLNPFPRKSTHL